MSEFAGLKERLETLEHIFLLVDWSSLEQSVKCNDNIPWRVNLALLGVSARSDAHSPSPRGAPGLELTVRCRSESQELTTLDLEAEISAEPFVSAVGIKVGCEANCRDHRWPSES